NAASSVQTIWSMPVIRNNGHITGFGSATAFAQVMAALPGSFGNILAGGLVVTGGGLLYTTGGYSESGPAKAGTSAAIDGTVPGCATFLSPRIVLGDASTQRLDAYGVDANGNPCNPELVVSCGPVVHLVTSDLGLGYGIARDPVSGDILFTTQSNDIWLVSDS